MHLVYQYGYNFLASVVVVEEEVVPQNRVADVVFVVEIVLR